MTMRGMMRRVVTDEHGTGHRLHVIGYSLAGKTGTAQIYDYEHKMYTHRYNASFLGFAPANNPAVVIIVTVSGTSGAAGYGGSAAGPAFVRLMQSAMNRLGIVRDVPEDIDELMAKKAKTTQAKAKPDEEADADMVADLTTPFSAEEMKDGGRCKTMVLAVTDGTAPKAPNFVGKTVRDVMQEATATGIEVDMLGDGLARAQNPPAGRASDTWGTHSCEVPTMNLSQVLAGVTLLRSSAQVTEVDVRGIAYDSRKVEPDSCFLLLLARRRTARNLPRLLYKKARWR